MLPLAALANPHVANKVLGVAGYAVGLSNEDVRTFSDQHVPVWLIAAVSAVAGGVIAVYAYSKITHHFSSSQKTSE